MVNHGLYLFIFLLITNSTKDCITTVGLCNTGNKKRSVIVLTAGTYQMGIVGRGNHRRVAVIEWVPWSRFGQRFSGGWLSTWVKKDMFSEALSSRGLTSYLCEKHGYAHLKAVVRISSTFVHRHVFVSTKRAVCYNLQITYGNVDIVKSACIFCLQNACLGKQGRRLASKILVCKGISFV